ncbi:Methyltransferase type 12 [Mycolicibacterium rhodesiae JS60]|nr:Methyltransferase type 12 [Mycolicibacterium rhodesiae JS60]
MMAYMADQITDIADMPRGGPDASWLDRLLETDRLEYLDRDDIDDEVKRGIVTALDRIGTVFHEHDRNAELVLREVADIADPKILELGAGHGALSRKVLEQHPTAHVTITDINAESVVAMAASDLGDHPRASVGLMDATAIDAPDGAYDLVVFALSFHHLSPAQAAQVLAEGSRVAGRMLVIDLPRMPSLLHIAKLAVMVPLVWWPFAHDGLISSLRSYSPSALRALGAYAGLDVDVSTNPFDRQVLLARRRA